MTGTEILVIAGGKYKLGVPVFSLFQFQERKNNSTVHRQSSQPQTYSARARFKGTGARDSQPRVFLLNRPHLDPLIHTLNYFQNQF